jgi:hypothetical protein
MTLLSRKHDRSRTLPPGDLTRKSEEWLPLLPEFVPAAARDRLIASKAAGNHVAPRGTSELLGPASLPDEFTAALVGSFTTPAIGPVDEFARLTRVNRRDGAIRGRARRDTGARAENRGNRASDYHS